MLARLFGGPSTALGRFLLSKAGSWVVLAGLGVGIAGGLGGGAWLMSRMFPPAQTAAAYSTPVLDGVSDSIRVRRPPPVDPTVKAAGLKYDDGGNALPNATLASPGGGNVPPQAQAPQTQIPQAPNQDALTDQARRAGLDISALKKMASVGGAGNSGGFGSMPDLQKNKLGDNDFNLKKNFVPADNFVKVKNLTPFDNRHPTVSTVKDVQEVHAQRAMGQLKFAKDASGAATTAGGQEAGKTFAADAFEQGQTTGGQVNGITDGASIAPPGTGAPNLTQTEGQNVTPYQNQIDQAQQDTGQSGMMKMAGMAMMAIGAAMIAAGALMTPTGWPLIAAGAALVLGGIAMLAMSQSLANQAQNQGNNIANQYGQTQQGNTVNNCSAQAAANGTSPQNCNSTFNTPTNNVQQSAQQESQSSFNIGGPVH